MQIKSSQKFMAVSKLVFRTFIGQPVGIIMSLVSPFVLFILIPYLINGISHSSMESTLEQSIPGLLLIPTIIISTLGIPVAFSALKENGIFKKLNVAGITPTIFISSLIFVFVFIILVSTLSLFIVSKILWQSKSPNPSGGAFLVSWFLLMVISIIIGLNIGNKTQSQSLAFAVGVLFFLPIIFLSGIIFPEMHGWIDDLSKVVLPQNHLTQLYNVAWHDNDLYLHSYHNGLVHPATNIPYFIYPGAFKNQVFNTILSYTYPSLLIFLGSLFLIKKFKWE